MRTEIAGGLLTGTGRVIAPPGTDSRGGVFNTRGTVRPGREGAAGTLRLGTASEATSYTQGRDGTLTIDVPGLQNFGRIEVNGAVTLGGTLRVITGSDTNILPGARLENVLSAAAIAGHFDTVETAIPGSEGLHWRPVIGETRIDLVAEPVEAD